MAEKATIILEALMNVSDVESKVGRIQKELKNLSIPKDIADNLTDGFNKLGPLLKDYKKQLKSGFTTQKDINNLNALGKEIDRVFSDIDGNIKKVNSEEIRMKFDLTSVKNAQADVNKFASKLEETISKTFDGISEKLAKNNNFQLSFLRNGAVAPSLKPIAKELMSAFDTRDIDKYREAYEKLRQSLTNIDFSSKTAKNIAQQMGLGEDALDSVDKVKSKIKELLESLRVSDTTSGVIDRTKASLEEANSTLTKLLQDAQSSGSNAFKGIQTGIEAASGSMKQLTADTTSYGQSVADANAQLKSLQQSTQYFFGLRNMVNLFKRGVREAVNTIKELDKVMTETAVVTKYSVSDMWSKLPEYTANANALGASVKDMYEATTLYYQQGLNTDQAMGIANETMKMARIGGLEAVDATDKMTAALRGFNMEINEMSAQRVNDVYSNLAAKTASNTKELGTAMQRTASIAASAGMSFEGTAAFLAQAIETTREPAENLGTAMKTIVARFTELKKNPLEITEVEGEEVSYNKVDTALQSIGVSLKDANGQFRALDQVFLDISQRWNSLTQTQQRYIATTAAGSRQQSRFIAMMSNYDRTMQLMEYATDSAGASQQQFDKTLESFEAKVNKLKNAWQQFTMGLADNKIVKVAVDGLTGFFNILNKILDKLSLGSSVIKSTLSLFAAFTGLKMGGRMVNSLIGGLGGMIDPNSSWSAGAKSGAVGSRSGGNPVLAGQISNPIVAAIREASGKVTAQQSMQNSALNQYHAFQQSRTSMIEQSKNGYSYKEVQKALSGLNYSNQNALMKSFSGTAYNLEKTIWSRYFNAAKDSPEALKALREAQSNIRRGHKEGQYDYSSRLALGIDERAVKKALNENSAGKKAAEEILNSITKGIEEQGNTAYNNHIAQATQKYIDNAVASGMSEIEAKEHVKSDAIQKNIKAEAEKARQEAENKARQGGEEEAAGANGKIAKSLDAVGKFGSGMASAGLGIQAFASTLTSSANPAVQAFGVALSSVGNMIYGIGMGLSQVGSALSNMAASEFMVSLAGTEAAAASLTGVFAALAVAIGALIYAIKKHKENIKKAAEEVSKTYKEKNEQTQSNITKLTEAQGEFARLSEGVDENGYNVSLDSADYNRYKEIVNQIAEINPSIVEGFNAQGDAIISNNEALEQTIQLQRQLQKEAAKDYTSSTSLAKILRARNQSSSYDDFQTLGTTKTKQSYATGILGAVSGGGVVSGALNMIQTVKNYNKLTTKLDLYFKKLKSFDIDTASFEKKFNIEGAFSGDTEALRKAAHNFDAITHYANQLNLTDKQLTSLAQSEDKAKEKLSNFNDEIQATYELLATYATEQGFGEVIADEYKTAFQNGIRSIAEQDLSSDEMLQAVDNLYVGISQKLSKNSKIQKANKAIQKAQDQYAQDLDKHAYEIAIAQDEITGAYEETIQEFKDLAAETGDETYNALAEVLENKLAKVSDITESSLADLNSAFDSVADHIGVVADAADHFGEVVDKIDPNKGAKDLKSIYDSVYNEDSTHALLHDAVYWEGVQYFASEDLYNSGDADAIDKLMKQIKPTLEEGADGIRATVDFFRANADGKYIIAEDDGNITANINTEEELEAAAKHFKMNTDAFAALLKRLGPLGLDFTDYDAVRKAYVNDERVIQGAEGTTSEGRLLISENEARSDAISGGKTPEEFLNEVIPELESRGVDILRTFKEGDDKNNEQIQNTLDAWGIDSSNYIEELIGVIPKEELQAIGENLLGDNTEDFDERYDEALLDQDDSLDKYRNDKLDQIESILSAWAKEAGYDNVSQGKATEKDFIADDFKEAYFGDEGLLKNWFQGKDADGVEISAPQEAEEILNYQKQKLDEYYDRLEKGKENADPATAKKYEEQMSRIDQMRKTFDYLSNSGLSSDILNYDGNFDFSSFLEQASKNVNFDDAAQTNLLTSVLKGILTGKTPHAVDLEQLGLNGLYNQLRDKELELGKPEGMSDQEYAKWRKEQRNKQAPEEPTNKPQKDKSKTPTTSKEEQIEINKKGQQQSQEERKIRDAARKINEEDLKLKQDLNNQHKEELRSAAQKQKDEFASQKAKENLDRLKNREEQEGINWAETNRKNQERKENERQKTKDRLDKMKIEEDARNEHTDRNWWDWYKDYQTLQHKNEEIDFEEGVPHGGFDWSPTINKIMGSLFPKLQEGLNNIETPDLDTSHVNKGISNFVKDKGQEVSDSIEKGWEAYEQAPKQAIAKDTLPEDWGKNIDDGIQSVAEKFQAWREKILGIKTNLPSEKNNSADSKPSNMPVSVNKAETKDSHITVFNSEGADKVKNEEKDIKDQADKGAEHITKFKTEGTPTVEGQLQKFTDSGSETKTIKVNADTKEAEKPIEKEILPNSRAIDSKMQEINNWGHRSISKNINYHVTKSGISTINIDVKTNNKTVGTSTENVNTGNKAHGAHNHGYVSAPTFNSAARGYGQLGPKGKGGLTLTGELGYEIAWLPSENRSMILGANGPQMVDLPGDAVVWTHEQSKKILKQKGIPAGSHGDKAKGTTDISKLGGSDSGGGGAGKRDKHKDKDDKKRKKNTDDAANVIKKAGKISAWWWNMGKKVEATQRIIDKTYKKINKLIDKAGTTLDDISKDGELYIDKLQQQISLNTKMKKKAEKGLTTLDQGTKYNKKATTAQKKVKAAEKKLKKAKKTKSKKDDKEARQELKKAKRDLKKAKELAKKKGGVNYATISYDKTIQKGKKKTKKPKKEKINLSPYIKYDKATGGYVIDEAKINKQKWDKAKKKAVMEAAQKKLEDKVNKKNTAEDKIDDAKEKLLEYGEQLYEAFRGWENELTKIYFLTQQIAEMESRISGLKSMEDLQENKLLSGLEGLTNSFKNDSLLYFKTSIAGVTRNLESRNQLIDAKRQDLIDLVQGKALKEEYIDLANQLKTTKDKNQQLMLQGGLEKIGNELKAINMAQNYINPLVRSDGTIDLQFNSDLFEQDRKNNRINTASAEIIQKYIKDIEEGNQELLSMYEEQISGLNELYETLISLQDKYADYSEELLKAVEDEAQERVDKIKDLSDAISNNFKELIDSVKSQIEERRRQEDNAKTEKDIVKKQNRLALLRANSAGGNVVAAAQLEQEIADAQQSYGRTLEDQLLDRLQQTGDKAEKQREQQIKLATAMLELNKINGVNIAEIDKYLDDPDRYQSRIIELIRDAKGYNTATTQSRARIDSQITTMLADLDPRTGIPKKIEDVTTEIGVATDKLSQTLAKFTMGAVQATGVDTSGIMEGVEPEGVLGEDDGMAEKLSKAEAEVAYRTKLLQAESNKKTSLKEIEKLKSLGKAAGYGFGQVLKDLANTPGITWKQILTALKGNYNKYNLALSFSSDAFKKAYNEVYKKDASGKKTAYEVNLAEAKKRAKTNPDKYKKYKFAQGGLADYTGPAWLDGTPSKPELVLNSTDTKNLIALKDVLGRVMSSTSHMSAETYGDILYEININVDRIEKDYDVDRVVDKVKKEIVKSAGYRNVTQVRNLR